MRRYSTKPDGRLLDRNLLEPNPIVFYDDFYTPSLAGKWRGSGVGVYTTGSGYVYYAGVGYKIYPLMCFDFSKIVHLAFRYKYDSSGGGKDLTIIPVYGPSDSGLQNLMINCTTSSYPSYNIFGPGQYNTSYSPVPGPNIWTKVDVIFSRGVQRLYQNDVLKVTRYEHVLFTEVTFFVDVHGTFYMRDFVVRYVDAPWLESYP
jgi:hypothetical protein